MPENLICDRTKYIAAQKANSVQEVRNVIYRCLHPLLVSQIYRQEFNGFNMTGHPASPAFAGAILIRADANSHQLRDFRKAGGIVLDTEDDVYLSPSKFLVREAYFGKASREHLLRLNEGRRLGLDLSGTLHQTLGSDEQSREKIIACLSVPLLEEIVVRQENPRDHYKTYDSIAHPLNPPRWIGQPGI